MVTSTGRIVPSWLCVRALNSLQNAMMLIPWGPRAVPTGGAGFARPAGIWSLTNPVTFFAIASPVRTHPSVASPHGPRLGPTPTVYFDVVVVSDGALLAASAAAPRKGRESFPPL